MTRKSRELAVIAALVAVYFVGMTALALTVDRGFFFNDAISAAVWILIGVSALGGALSMGRR